MGVTLHLGDYDMVYRGNMTEISGTDKLDAIFAKCNQDIPAGYMGHSLSVSDVIVLKTGSLSQLFLLNRLDFKRNRIWKQNCSRTLKEHSASTGEIRALQDKGGTLWRIGIEMTTTAFASEKTRNF